MDACTNELNDELKVLGYMKCLDDEVVFEASMKLAKMTYTTPDPEGSSCIIFTREEWGDKYLACARRYFIEKAHDVASFTLYTVSLETLEQRIQQGQT
jgi:hypothetical protein